MENWYLGGFAEGGKVQWQTKTSFRSTGRWPPLSLPSHRPDEAAKKGGLNVLATSPEEVAVDAFGILFTPNVRPGPMQGVTRHRVNGARSPFEGSSTQPVGIDWPGAGMEPSCTDPNQ